MVFRQDQLGRGKTPPAITSEIPFQAGEMQANRTMLFAFSEPGLSHRDADIKLRPSKRHWLRLMITWQTPMEAMFQLRNDTLTNVKEIFSNFCCKQI